MMTEQEKRQHRCCFAGHKPENIRLSEGQVKQWLRDQIAHSIHEGYTTYITGMGMGVDIWAAQIVLDMKKDNSALRLIAVVPYPMFPAKWSQEWAEAYQQVLTGADLVRQIAPQYGTNVLNERNQWIVAHSSRLIGIYNGAEGHTGQMVQYARKQGLNMCLYPFPKIQADPEALRGYPLNLLDAIMACETYQASRLVERTDLPVDFDNRLTVALYAVADDRATSILLDRYREGNTLQVIGDKAGISKQRIGQLIEKYIKRLRQPDILRYLNCGIENIPERTSRTMLKRIEEQVSKMQPRITHDTNHDTDR